MKTRNIFACVLTSITFIAQTLLSGALDSAADTITINSIESNRSAFFELPLSEIETLQNADTLQRDADQVAIKINISKKQLQKQLSDLETQKNKIETFQTSFRTAYFDLMLEKLHLTGIYNMTDPEYLSTTLPSAWIDETDSFTIVAFEGDEDALCFISLQYDDTVTLEFNGEKITMTPYEAAQRTLYVINTYGDMEYFTSAYDNLRGKYINESVNLGDVTCDNFVDVSDTVLLARFIAEDSEAIMTAQGKTNADANRDGDITLDDVTCILRKIAKID